MKKGLLLTALALVAVTDASVVSMPQALAAQQKQTPLAQVVNSIRAAIAAQPASATVIGFEGVITYAADQTRQPGSIVVTAMTNLLTERHLVVNARQALRNLLRRRRTQQGTAGILSGMPASLQAGPSITGGGGQSSDYSTP